MKTIIFGLVALGLTGTFAETYSVSWEGRELTLEDARISSVPFCRVWPGHQREKSQTEMSHFVRFDWTKGGVFTVKGAGVGKALKDLLPLSAREIAKPAGDDALALAIGRPGAYVLEFDGLPALHVFADPPLAPVPAPGPGGKLIRFAKGEHHPGVVAPKSGDVVVLDEGAVVYGSLFVLNATNVTVTGRGIFDGSKLERADESMRAFRRANGLPEIDTESACFAYSVYGSENVTISGVTFRDPPFWTLVIRNQCRKTLVDNIHIVGNWRYNSDGIDVCASAETEIRNSFIRTFDDCVIARGPYMKGEFAPVSGMTVTNCDLWADWGVVFKAQVQDFHGSTIEDVRMKDCRFMNLQSTGVFLAVRYGCDLDIIRRMTFEDLEYDFRPQLRSKIQQTDGEAFVSEPFTENYLLYAGSYTLGKNLDNQQNAPMEDPDYYHFLFEDIACRRIRTYGEKRNLVVTLKADVPRHEIRRVTVEDVPPHRLSRSRRVEVEDRTALDTEAAALVTDYVNRFRAESVEIKTNAIPDAAALPFLLANVPRFECPDKEIERAYYFRWWTFRRHLRQTPSGCVITEFLPDVGWAGKYNTINCATGHHVMEGRWLRDTRYVDDYLRFMLTEGTMNGPRSYVCWPAFALLEKTRLTGDWTLVGALFGRLVDNFEKWEKGWTVTPYPCLKKGDTLQSGLRPNGLYAITDDREGSEVSGGGDGYRPLVNAAMVGEARALAEMAAHRGDRALQRRFADKAAVLEQKMKELLWNPDRSFFTVLSRTDEHKAVRELFGYAPWYFGLDLSDYGAAWRPLMRTDGFLAPAGLADPERSAKEFSLDYRNHSRTPCCHNGPTWPYGTSLALTALANALQTGNGAGEMTAADYQLLLRQYAAAHRLVQPDGQTVSWIDETWDPFTGDCYTRRVYVLREAEKKVGRGQDYNHSTFCDLVLSGLCGIRPKLDGTIDLKPLAPKEWDYFRVSNLRLHGHDVEVVWDRSGERYGRGKGLILRVDGYSRIESF